MTAAALLIWWTPYIFGALAVTVCGTAALVGGWEGRWTAFIYALALVGTKLADRLDQTWGSPNATVALIDGALLIGLYVVTLCSRRYWPIWLSGFQLLTVSAHISAWIVPSYFYKAYFALSVVWSLPKLGVLLFGVLVHWRRDRDRRVEMATSAGSFARDCDRN